MTDKSYAISKTSFIKFEQCEKAFFLYKNHPYLRDKPSTEKQLTFKRGHDVGFYARQLFPGGTDVAGETKNRSEALELTKQLIEDKKEVIYEATFLFNGVLVMADILCFQNGSYTAYEVKSSLKVSETYLKDACLQYYVIKNVLPQLDEFFLVTLNPDYILENETEPKKLFRRRSVKQKAEAHFSYFESRINEALGLLEKNTIPNIALGTHCFKPYQCDFYGTCWKNTNGSNSIFNLPLVNKAKAFEWFNEGIFKLEDLAEEKLERPLLNEIKNAILTKHPIIKREEIKTITDKIKLPVAAMDMEIWNPAIPQLKGTKPFDQIPFLVSFYNGTAFEDFFTDYTGDCREEFAAGLIQLSQSYNTLLVYDKTLELSVINNLMERFPSHAMELDSIKKKLVDISEIFINFYYYDPAFKSNFSLKGISGTLLKDVNYASIGSGMEAMSYFDNFRQEQNLIEKERLKQELINYCNTDCFATYHLLEFLQQATLITLG